jgi:hypothetical protein
VLTAAKRPQALHKRKTTTLLHCQIKGGLAHKMSCIALDLFPNLRYFRFSSEFCFSVERCHYPSFSTSTVGHLIQTFGQFPPLALDICKALFRLTENFRKRLKLPRISFASLEHMLSKIRTDSTYTRSRYPHESGSMSLVSTCLLLALFGGF